MAGSAERPSAGKRAGSVAGAPADQAPGAAAALARRAWPLVALLCLTLFAYSDSFGAAFQFDDERSIVGNPVLRDPASFLPGGPGWSQRPNRGVGYLTLALNRWAGGLDPAGYHAVNLAIHLLAALLVQALAVLCFRTPRLKGSALAPHARAAGWVAALLFATHPLQTEAVTYVVQRLTSLAAAFCLLALVQYLRWRTRPAGSRGTPAYALALVSMALAMRTKEIAFTFPLVIGLFELCLFEGPWKRRLAGLAPFLASMAIIPATLLSASGARLDLGDVEQLTRVQTSLGRLDYLATELPVLARYLRLLLLPAGQNLDHDVPPYHSFLAPPVVAAGILLLLLAAGAAVLLARAGRRERALDPAARLVALGVAWFFLTSAVESSVIPIVDVMFEHRVYLPSVGLFLAASVGGAFLARRLAGRRGPVALAAAGLAVAAALSVATYARNEVWASPLTLWGDAAAKSPGKSRPQNNYGAALTEAHREDEAEPHVREAIRLDPANAEARYNLGRILLLRGEYPPAVESFRTALDLQPDYPEAWANLGATLNRLHRYGETVALLGDGARLAGSGDGHFNLGVAFAALGDEAGARREIQVLESLESPLAGQLASYLRGLRAPAR